MLAREVCSLVHGEAETDRAARASEALYSEDISGLDEAMLLQVFSDAPSSSIARSQLDAGGIGLLDALVSSGLVKSRSEGQRALAQGGVYLNNRRRSDAADRIGPEDLLAGRYVVLRRGRRDYHLLRFA